MSDAAISCAYTQIESGGADSFSYAGFGCTATYAAPITPKFGFIGTGYAGVCRCCALYRA